MGRDPLSPLPSSITMSWPDPVRATRRIALSWWTSTVLSVTILRVSARLGEAGRWPAMDVVLEPFRRDRQSRHRRKQLSRIGLARSPQYARCRALLHDPARLQHDRPPAKCAHHAKIMGDHQDRQVPGRAQLREQRDDLTTGDDIERAHGLVGEEHARSTDDRPGDRDALALSARELVRVAGGGIRRQAHGPERVCDECVCRAAMGDPQGPHRLAHDATHALAWIERRVGVLEHGLHAATERADL